MSDLVEIGAMWESESDKVVMSGKLGNAKLIVLKNNFKEVGSKQPDYRLFVAPYEKKETATNETEVPDF